jgi:isochorismate pyruvate lyase
MRSPVPAAEPQINQVPRINLKVPEACSNLQEIRAEIDQLDQQIITALGERFAYVKAASKFKTSETSVKAPERLQSMLQQRRLWAEEAGLNPDVIEKLYQDLVNHFIDEEMQHWQSQQKP